MRTLEYDVTINAPAKYVWKKMLQPATYRKWVDVSWPGSYYEGKWARNEIIKFLTPDLSGTIANIIEFKTHKVIDARHTAVLQAGGKEDKTSALAKGWIGTRERYEFSEHDGKTVLKVIIETSPQWAEMFNDGWPGALLKLKEICE